MGALDTIILIEASTHNGPSNVLLFQLFLCECFFFAKLLFCIHLLDASRRGKKMLTSSRDKNEGTYDTVRGVGRGEEAPPLCDPRSELLLGGSARREVRE